MHFLLLTLLAVVTTFATITKRTAINRDNFPELLWPTDRPIRYRFTSDFSAEDIPGVKYVLEEIASKTCLTFKDVTNESGAQSDDPTIIIKNGTDCKTERVGKPLNSTLHISFADPNCRRPFKYYELILYALGMFETHVRPDRDDYVSVHEEDILPDKVKLFDKMSDYQTSTYGVPYDFDSLMHFPPDMHQKTKDIPTMVAKDPLNQPGMGMNYDSPSHSDYLLLNRLYRCFDRCDDSEVNCENGGFMNPNDCTKCICPRGFTGGSCNKLAKKGCGNYEASTTSWRRLSVRLINENTPCYWFLTAPPGRQIEIKLEHIVPEDPQCPITPYTWLEVRLGNFIVGGYKFFCNGHIPNHTLISEGNLTVLTLRKNVLIELELIFRNVEAKSGSTGSTLGVSLMIMFLVAIVTI